jgi:hypothetical protein
MRASLMAEGYGVTKERAQTRGLGRRAFAVGTAVGVQVLAPDGIGTQRWFTGGTRSDGPIPGDPLEIVAGLAPFTPPRTFTQPRPLNRCVAPLEPRSPPVLPDERRGGDRCHLHETQDGTC